MIRTVVIGAAGRMGKALITAISQDPATTLSGAVEIADSPFLGLDAGTLAGVGNLDVAITSDLSAVLAEADAVIDFSAADAALKHAHTAVINNCRMVIGTTGLAAADRAKLKALADQGGTIVFAPNMSVGVNLLFHLCDQVARILGDDYDIEVVEMHHSQKKDAPSGTAERLGEILAAARGLNYNDAVRHGREGMVGARTCSEIGMHALRGGDVVGDHTVTFATNGERLELTHKASSRATFAKGAVRAVKFLATMPAGLYDMQDVLGLRSTNVSASQ